MDTTINEEDAKAYKEQAVLDLKLIKFLSLLNSITFFHDVGFEVLIIG